MIKATKSILVPLAAFLFGSTAGHAADWLTLPAKPGTANGKKIVRVQRYVLNASNTLANT